MKRRHLKGSLILLGFLIIFILASYVPLYSNLSIPEGGQGDSSSPWYFLITDLKSGISAFIGLILTLILCFSFIKKFADYAKLGLFFGFLYFGGAIGSAIIVFATTTNVLNSELATTSWATSSDYINNFWKSYGNYIYMAVVLVIYFLTVGVSPKIKSMFKRQSKELKST